MLVYIHKSISNLLRLGATTLCLCLLVPQVFAEQWTYVQKIEKSFYTAYQGNQSQALINAAVAIPIIQNPGESLKVSVRVPAGVTSINVSTQGVFGGVTGGRPLIARFDYDPSEICISSPSNCPATGAPMLTPPFHSASSSLSETIYNDVTLSVEEANINGGKTVAVTIYHGAAAPAVFALGKLSISLGVTDVASYNAWINNTEINPTHTLTIATDGSGSVSSSPTRINCGSNLTTCTAKFNEGVAVALTATPATGFTLDKWDGDCTGSNATTTVAMTTSKNCIAVFTNNEVVKLNINVNGNGLVSSNPSGINCGNDTTACEKTDVKNKAITLIASPSDNTIFENWSGDCTGNDVTTSVVLTTNKQCTANFKNKDVSAVVGMDRSVFMIPNPNKIVADSVSMKLSARIDEYEALPYFLSNTDEGATFPLEDSVLSLNLSIIPDNSLINSNTMDILLLANWTDNEGNEIWLQKTKAQGSFDFNDDNVWSKFILNDSLANGFTPYLSELPSDTGFSTSIGSGKVVAPIGLGSKGRTLTFYPAYQQKATDTGAISYLVAKFTLKLPDNF